LLAGAAPHLNGFSLLPSRQRTRDTGLDFLGASPFGCESPAFELLDSFGFPWILSSESRLFNGLREINAEIFSGAFAAGVDVVTTGSRDLGM
jgi:hypothetical protein